MNKCYDTGGTGYKLKKTLAPAEPRIQKRARGSERLKNWHEILAKASHPKPEDPCYLPTNRPSEDEPGVMEDVWCFRAPKDGWGF